MNAYLEAIQRDQDIENSLIVTAINHRILFSSPRNPQLMEIYDQLVDIWITNLPVDVSGLARLAKFKSVSKIAVEIYLSSLATIPRIAVPDTGDIEFPSGHKAKHGVPKSAQTLPVLSSKSTAGTKGELEDPAISRLRRYATSIASQPVVPNTRLLSQWPSVPGADPLKYSWAAANEASSTAENLRLLAYRGCLEEKWRRKRTENFLGADTTISKDTSSFGGDRSTGSQPTHHSLSFQVLEELPMTQPDRGVFGSRTTSMGVKRKKPSQRRAAGF